MVIIWYICAHSRVYIHSASVVLSLCFKVKGQQDEIAIIEAIYFSIWPWTKISSNLCTHENEIRPEVL
jgi:hypothetical protein